MSDAHLLINNEVNAREKRAQGLIAVGKKPPKTADTIGWMVEVADQKGFVVKLTELQLNLTVVAIHTTSSALSRAIIDLCRHPEVVQPMREEIIEVIGSEGWSKTSLYKLRLMDSFLKESSRCVPQSHSKWASCVKLEISFADSLTYSLAHTPGQTLRNALRRHSVACGSPTHCARPARRRDHG